MVEERKQAILQELEEKGKVRVAELSEKFHCSEVTIRKDIQQMDEEGLLLRTHGGALPVQKEDDRKYPAESLYRFTSRKKLIAACAYEFIEDRDTIILDDASTSFYLAVHIKNHPKKRIAVVTNSLLAGNELAGVPHVELYMVGGYVGGHLAATMGNAAVQSISQLHVDKAFIGVHGVNFNVGFTSIGNPQMEVKQAILKAAERTYVLADSSKFGGGYLSVICPIKKVDKIITDDAISSEIVKRAEKEKVSLVIAR